MTGMFSFAESFNQSINNWDVSNVISMENMFGDATSFNQPLDNWDVSGVEDMSAMFRNADLFDQPLNNWDVSGATDMSSMFSGNDSFNQPLNDWDVSGVADMNNMFRAASAFNQPLNDWDVSGVTNMFAMFWYNSSFDQPLNNWDVSNVTNMSNMFSETESFNQPLNDWDVSSVINMDRIFKGAESFNGSINSWDVSNLTEMNDMFQSAETFNQPLDNWDVSNVTDMSAMFKWARSFNQSIDNWNVSNVEDMHEMFFYAEDFDQPLDNWDVSGVTDMEKVFSGAESFNQPLNNWDVSNVTDMREMFRHAELFNQPLDNWNVSNVGSGSFDEMFQYALSFNQSFSSWDFSHGNLYDFISGCGMDSDNYDLLLDRLFQLGLENGNLDATSFSIDIYYCDAFTRQLLINAGWTITDGGLADDCNLNYVSGSVLFDQANDGCDAGDFDLSNYLVNISNGSESVSFAVDENGQYVVNVLPPDFVPGTYTLNVLNLSSNFTSTPSTQTVTLTSVVENLENIDFCITANQELEDLSVDIFPLEDAIPGFETDYQVIVSNNGTQTVPNVQLTFAYDESVQSFDSATEIPSENTTGLLTFSFDDVEPFSTEIAVITMVNAAPPALNSGDALTFTAEVSPSENDLTPFDNISQNTPWVVNSYDPNDKFVVQGDEVPDEAIDEYLDYRIRFQNLGTANALNVVITDTLSDKLDWTTFQPVSSSHDYRIELRDEEEVNFIFENIDLPYEELDEEGSNGYITYKIKPKSDVQIGDVMENTAYIFFDFNLPIVTNTVSTTIVDVLSTADAEKPEIAVYPNPASDDVYLNIPPDIQINQVRLYNIHGQEVKAFDGRAMLKLNDISSGFYLLQIDTNMGLYQKRLVKD